MKIINKVSISYLLYYTGLLHTLLICRRLFNIGGHAILMAHRVLPATHNDDSEIDAMALLSGHALEDNEFEKRLKFFLKYFRSGDPSELESGKPCKRTVYLTLDDGYLDNIEYAEPVLKRLNMKAIIFIIGDLVTNPDTIPWWDAWGKSKYVGNLNLAAVKTYGTMCNNHKHTSKGLRRDTSKPYEYRNSGQSRLYMNLEELNFAHSRGTYYFGSHTMSHPALPNLNRSELEEEIGESIRQLQSVPGYLAILAYPFGFSSADTKKYLKENTTLQCAFSTGYGTNSDSYSLRRININMRPFPLLIAEALNIFRFLRR